MQVCVSSIHLYSQVQHLLKSPPTFLHTLFFTLLAYSTISACPNITSMKSMSDLNKENSDWGWVPHHQ